MLINVCMLIFVYNSCTSPKANKAPSIKSKTTSKPEHIKKAAQESTRAYSTRVTWSYAHKLQYTQLQWYSLWWTGWGISVSYALNYINLDGENPTSFENKITNYIQTRWLRVTLYETIGSARTKRNFLIRFFIASIWCIEFHPCMFLAKSSNFIPLTLVHCSLLHAQHYNQYILHKVILPPSPNKLPISYFSTIYKQRNLPNFFPIYKKKLSCAVLLDTSYWIDYENQTFYNFRQICN